MDKKTSNKNKISNLKKLLEQWNYEYYILNESKVSDSVYDQKLQELIKLEKDFPEFATNDSPTQKVGGGVNESFQKYNHKYPMLSLSNAFSKQDLIDFDKTNCNLLGVDSLDYVCELKIDGLSISLEYENQKLIRGCTRGDGEIGEDITLNVKKIKSVPLNINDKENLTIRGEAFISKTQFAKINNFQIEEKKQVFANPRNAVAGTLRQLDSSVVSKRKVDIFVYYYLAQHPENSQYDSLKKLESLKFKVNPEYKLCKNIEEVCRYIEHYEKLRLSLPYEIDGIVIKVNKMKHYDKIGKTFKYPKWAIAYKFPAESAETTINKIFATLGRTGKITYNAALKPVTIAGTIVKAATLHNAENIITKDIRIGDYVKIQKAGEIIPEVLEAVLSKRPKNLKPWYKDKNCPACGYELVQYDGLVDQYCNNKNCDEKKIKSLEHFCSRRALNIEGLSISILRKLYDAKLVVNYQDLFLLSKKPEIALLKNFGQKSYENLINAVNKSKNTVPHKILFGLGIRHVGERTAKILLDKYKDIMVIAMVDEAELSSIYDIGPKVARSITDFFALEVNQNLLKDLSELGLNLKVVHNKDNLFWKYKKFVITGKLSKNRGYFTDLIESHGGIVTNSITKTTDYLITGENPGTKIEKALANNVKILSEIEFLAIIDNNR